MQSECRTCLEISYNVLDIFFDRLRNKISTISSLEISPNDGFTSKICEECVRNVHLLHSFRTQIIKSQNALEENVVDVLGCECRICLKVPDKYLDILTDGLYHKIETMSSVEILPHDRFSKNICSKCARKVHSLYRFRNTIIKSWKTLVERRIKTKNVEIKEEPLDELLVEIKPTVRKPKTMIVKRRIHLCKCMKCNYLTPSYAAWKSHIRSHEEQNSLCEVCGKVVLHVQLSSHMARHTETLPTCKLCGKTLKNQVNLMAHLRNHKQKECQCLQCGIVLKGKRGLNAHMLRHARANNKPNKCSMCELSFFNASGLKNHMRSHTGERPYPCATCNKRFSSTNALRTHIRQHTQEKPFTCDYCDAAFKQAVLVRRHMKSKHPEKVVVESNS